MNQIQNGRAECTARPRYKLVFWDWNGTLLDDLDYAIGVRNRTFPRFGLPVIHSREEYFQQFTFPVRVYYERAGVTEENFVEVANAWMDEYIRGADSIPLHGDALETVQAFQAAGLFQVVLSASDIRILAAQLAQYGLEVFFQKVLGLGHIYATSKRAIGQEYLRECGVPAGQCVLIGDSLHDAEVAREMGIGCVLVARGHQSEDTLRAAGVKVCGTLGEARVLVLGK